MRVALINAALVGAGGFIGAMCRYGLSGLVQRSAALSSFPYGTLAVNMLGCFLIGLAIGLNETRQPFGAGFGLFALVGILGGFTTYSAFGFETFALLRDANYLHAAANVVIHIVLGLALVWLGYALVSR